MSATTYDDLITKSFRDDAIRSVLMIDDQFLPYDELVGKFTSDTNMLTEEQTQGATRAANLHRFFQKEKKIICDVDTGIANLDVHKIRKSDLIILDYELEYQDPTKSIKLIGELRDSPHMNLVVLYTQQTDLTKVWLKISSFLRGSTSVETVFESDQDAKKEWDEKTDHVNDIPLNWLQQVSEEDISKYILSGKFSEKTAKYFCQTLKLQNLGKIFCGAVCEKKIGDFNEPGIPRSNFPIIGSNDSIKWIQSNNVFVVLHTKSTGESESLDLWNALKNALHEWRPSYYRLLISEIQNMLENESLSFGAALDSDLEGQTAWLHQIVSRSDGIEKTKAINQLLDRLTDELKLKVIDNPSLKNAIEETFCLLSNDATKTIDNSKIAANFVKFSASNVKASATDLPAFEIDMFHSLNSDLCLRLFSGTYVTCGTVLKSADETRWFLCVSPACETVPEQHTGGEPTRRLVPHRLIKLIILEECSNIKGALEKAADGRHIFLKERHGPRRAFAVQSGDSHLPVIDFAIIHEHDQSHIKSILTDGISVSFLHVKPGKNKLFANKINLLPVAQLRDSYAARFQSVASQHVGRIGVDFVNISASK